MIALYGTLLAFALAAGMLVVRYDMYEREPWPMILSGAAAGFVAMWGIGDLEDWTLARLGGSDPGPAILAAIAAVEEELARFAIVAAIAFLLPSQLNDPMDGIIYGSVVGLGMAVEESIQVLLLHGHRGPALPAAEPVRLCGHLVLGGIGGYGVGIVRLGIRHGARWLCACLAIAVAIHFVWDWIAFTAAERGVMETHETVAAILLMTAGMAAYGTLVVRGAEASRIRFAPSAARTLWGWPFR